MTVSSNTWMSFVLTLTLLLFIGPDLIAQNGKITANSAPSAPPGTLATTQSFSNSETTTITLGSPVSSTIDVSIANAYILDVDLTTTITHDFGNDLDIALTSPSGTVVVITTDNGANNSDVFNGTVFDDSAPSTVTDYSYTDGAAAPSLVPENPLAAFLGENPNGTWTLYVVDDENGDDGEITAWSLDITSLDKVPQEIPTQASATPGSAISNAVPTTSVIEVSGAEPYLLDLSLTTNIEHPYSSDLDIFLTSPQGTTTTIATKNGGGKDNVYNGSVWNDANPISASEANYAAPFAPAGPLAPEGAFAAFTGEDPNGSWTLTIMDTEASDDGTLVAWTLDLVGGAVPLPVELASFSAQTDGDQVLLSWSTASEKNNAGFEVQQKMADDSFDVLTWIPGGGSTSEENSYSFTVDNIEYGKHAFRLKQIDFDGSHAYSQEIEVSREIVGGYILKKAYPNPFNPQTSFGILMAQDQKLDVRVYNLMGQKVADVFSGQLSGQEWHQLTFESAGLPSGTYFINSVGIAFENTQKVILMK